MNKIIIIGCPGSGKSTFARALHAKTGIPLYYLDRMYWNADGTHSAREALITKQQIIFPLPQWIIDGNYGSTMELRLTACDTVFLLDYPTEICLEGIRQRAGKPRPDMPWVEDPERPNEEFEEFIRTYNERERPKVLARLNRFNDKTIYVFKNRTDAYGFLRGLPHHVSKTRTQMPMSDRAAQFAPFAAFTGYDDAVKETGRLTDDKISVRALHPKPANACGMDRWENTLYESSLKLHKEDK